MDQQDLPESVRPVAEPPREPAFETYAFANVQVDLSTQQLLKDGQPVSIGVKAFDTLVALLRHRNRVVTKEELMKWMWPDSYVSEDSLTHTISSIRRALGDDASQPRFITTVARRGYRFIAPVVETRPNAAALTTAADVTAATPPAVTPPSVSAPARFTLRQLTWAAAGAAIAVVVVLAIQQMTPLSSAAAGARPLRFTETIPVGTTLASSGVLSPDGHYLAFVARDDRSGRTRIWIRTLDSSEMRALEGTDGARRPFWSPNSASIGFFADSRVQRVGLGGGGVQSLARTIGANPAGGTWNSGGAILFSDTGVIYSVMASGGVTKALVSPDRMAKDVSVSSPEFLPDGRHFLYAVNSLDPKRMGTWVGSMEGGTPSRLLDASSSSVTFSPDGYLVYVHDGVLVAQSFDTITLQLKGDARSIVGSVSENSSISTAANGLLSFGGGPSSEALAWYDQTGQRQGTIASAVLNNPAFSDDGAQLIGSSTSRMGSGLWLVDLDRGVPTRLIPDGGSAVWAPDGKSIAYTATRGQGVRGIYQRSLMRGNNESLLLGNEQSKVIQDWSPDGRYIVYSSDTTQTRNDLWLLPLFGDRKPVLYLDSAAKEIQAQVSPDGRWMAYVSDESGKPEVYVQSFPVAGSKRGVSSGGGAQPQWRADGRELYFLSLDNTLMVVSVDMEGLQVGRPRALFKLPLLGGLTDVRNLYAVAPKGERLLVRAIDTQSPQDPITMLVHWPGLAER